MLIRNCSRRLIVPRTVPRLGLVRAKHRLARGSELTGSEKENVPLPQKTTIPPAPIHRVTYEYPPPPKPKPEIPKESTTWKRHLPLAIGLGSLLWAGYAVYYFFGDKTGSQQTVLTPDAFSTYQITNKQAVSSDTCLIELAPKYAASSAMLKSGATLWNAKRLWSVQVKHPMIQIARNYTPLPLYFMQPDRPGLPPLLRIMGTSADEGRMTLLVKRYEDGEMSRYLHSLPVGSDVEIRGPFVEYKFPYGPADQQPMRQPMLDNPSRMKAESQLDPSNSAPKAETLAMFTAGTGITTAFQLLLSPHNPPRGFVEVYHSARTREDVPFDRFRLFLESVGRAKFHIYIDDENRYIGPDDIPVQKSLDSQEITEPSASPNSKKYLSVLQQYADVKKELDVPLPSRSVVCGPPGYVTYVSGDPGMNGDSEIGGLLGPKGWSKESTKRMLDL